MAKRHRNGDVEKAFFRNRKSMFSKSRTIFILIIVLNAIVVKCSHNETDEDIERVENEIPKRLKIVEAISGRGFADNLYNNGTFRTGNSLWDNILNKCTLKPSVTCLQKNFYTYLDNSLNFNGDLSVTSGVCFKKNSVDMNRFSKEADIIYLAGSKDKEDRSFEDENEIKDDEEPGKFTILLLQYIPTYNTLVCS